MDFAVTILSKEKFSSTLSDAELTKAFRARFDGNVPIQHIDCVFVQSLGAPIVEVTASVEGTMNEGGSYPELDGRGSTLQK